MNFIGISVSLFIVIADELLEYISDIIIDWIGFHSRSELAMRKKNIIFFLTFFHTGILLLLINANFSGTGIPILGYIFHGKFQDFNSSWFFTIGAQITSVLIFMIIKYPIVFIKYYIFSFLK